MFPISDSLMVSFENLSFLDVFVMMVAVGLLAYFMVLLECLFNRTQETSTKPNETPEKYVIKNSSRNKNCFKFFMKKKVSFNEEENRVYIII